MNKKNKTHYRKVFKSDHLGVADLEEFIEDGLSLIFTISHVNQHLLITDNNNSGVMVAGRRIGANIAHFKEKIKPLVLNAVNSKQVSIFAKSKFVEDWNNITIELFADPNVKMKGQLVGGVRIRKIQPTKKTKPKFTSANFEKAKKAGATIKIIQNSYEIDTETILKYKQYVTA